MLGIGKTDIGRVRSNNEDSVLIKNEPLGMLPNLYIVADGMGGHKAGEVASNLAITACCDYLIYEAAGEEILDTLIDAVRAANATVFKYAMDNTECANMGTTFVGCCVSGSTAYIVHVGDSRLYRIGKESIEQITTDHSYVAEMVRAGKLTQEEAEIHPDRNIITRALGTNASVETDGIIINTESNDILLLCSDGLNTMLRNDEILSIVRSGGLTLEQRLDMLIDAANERGGKDNISAILIDLGEVDKL